jgi:hypothetical protein
VQKQNAKRLHLKYCCCIAFTHNLSDGARLYRNLSFLVCSWQTNLSEYKFLFVSAVLLLAIVKQIYLNSNNSFQNIFFTFSMITFRVFYLIGCSFRFSKNNIRLNGRVGSVPWTLINAKLKERFASIVFAIFLHNEWQIRFFHKESLRQNDDHLRIINLV